MKNDLYYYTRLIKNATDTGNAKKSGTFEGWQQAAIITRAALMKARADYNEDLRKYSETYAPKVLAEKKAELDERYGKIVAAAKSSLTESLDDVIESKRRQFDKCSGAPSEEDLRLLQALSMRTTLTVADVANVAGKLNGNIQSFAVLRDIAAKHEIFIPAGATTPEEFDTMIARAREFSLDRLNEIGDDSADMGYKGRSFYDFPDQPGEASHFYGPLDHNTLTTEQVTAATRQAQQTKGTAKTAPETTEAGENGTGQMWAEVTASGQLDLFTIAEQFHVSTQQIKDANPGKDLTRIYTGDKIIVPSTRFSFEPDPTGAHVQPDMVKAIPRPEPEYPTGPNGEAVGEDVSIV